MKKSVYSIVLMDQVVSAVDRIAYSKNTNRSNMINQILAEYCSFITPEKRINDIFEYAMQLMSVDDAFQLQTTDAILSIKSALSYKYNPVIRYSVELYRVADSMIGELKVNFRTQNQMLIAYLTNYFELWTEMENNYVKKSFQNEHIPSSYEKGRFERQFIMPNETQNQTTEQLAKAIADYVQTFDRALKIYFANINDEPFAKKQIEKCYLQYLNTGSTII